MSRLVVGVVALLVMALGWQSWQLARERSRVRDLVLRADSVEAAADTTRAVSARALKVLGDSVQAVERRVVQERQAKDALDRALGRERIARAGVTVELDSLRAVVQAPVTSDPGDSVRSARFVVDEVAVTGTAVATLPRPPAAGSLDLRLAVRPIPLHLRLGCGPAVNGMRPATALLAGPTWAALTLDSLSQDPGLCRSPILEERVSRWKWAGVGGGIVLAILGLLGWV